nr:unnamed protein product [Spirometra erinaceieuropaei]
MVSDKTDKLSCTSEAIWLTIKAPGSPSLDILTVYRPPRNDPTADARLIEDLERFSIRSEVLIMGDFNAPLIDWSSAYASGPDHAFDRRLLDMTFKFFLTQHVSFPTRVREGQQSNCLDLLLTKSLDSVDEVQCLPPLGRSDHVVLLWEYSIFSLPEQATRVRRNIWRGDFAQMKSELNTINWESAFSGDIIKDWDWFRHEPSAGPLVQSTKIFSEVGIVGSILDDFPDFYAIRKHSTITVKPIYTIIDEQEKEGWSEHRALWDPILYECAP